MEPELLKLPVDQVALVDGGRGRTFLVISGARFPEVSGESTRTLVFFKEPSPEVFVEVSILVGTIRPDIAVTSSLLSSASDSTPAPRHTLETEKMRDAYWGMFTENARLKEEVGRLKGPKRGVKKSVRRNS
jgi:hypothetical protein